MGHKYCTQLLEASSSLFLESGLVIRKGESVKMVHPEHSDEDFEKWLSEKFTHEYGRYVSWVLFLVAAENLVKATYVCKKSSGNDKMPSRTLGPTVNELIEILGKGPSPACKEDLCDLNDQLQKLVRIRNRDAHHYRRRVRAGDYPKIGQYFLPAFRFMIQVMKHNGHPLEI